MSFLKKWGKRLLIIIILFSILYSISANPRIQNSNIIEKEYKMCDDYTKEYCKVIDDNLKDSGLDSKQCKMCVDEWKKAKDPKKKGNAASCTFGYYYDSIQNRCVRRSSSGSSSSQARQVGSSSGSSGSKPKSCGSKPCFPFGTKILMEDGTTKQIQNICLGDNTKGGIVTGFHVFPLNKNDIFNYKGVIVAGSHRVLEDNKWIKVRDSKISKLHSKEIDNNNNMLYDFDTTNHRIIIADNPDVIFADYIEVDDNNNLIDNIEKMILNKIHLKKMKQQKTICYK